MLSRIATPISFAAFAGLLAFFVWQESLIARIPSQTAGAHPKDRSQQPLDEREREIIATEAVAAWTRALGIFTAVLAGVSIAQLIFIGRSDKTARISSEAAKESSIAAKIQSQEMVKATGFAEREMLLAGLQADILEKQKEIARREFLITHRPKIVCLFFETYTGTDEADGVEITYVNAGSADATIIEIGKAIVPTNNLRPGAHMEITPDRKHLASGEKGKTSAAHMAIDLARVQADHKSLGPGTSTYCIGYIAYEDAVGIRRETGFCRLFDPEGNRWLPVKDSEYEYSY